MNANTSADEARQAREEVAKAWKDVADASKKLKNVQIDASEKAYKEMMKPVDSAITGETTLGDSARIIATGVKQPEAELKDINTTVCGVK